MEFFNSKMYLSCILLLCTALARNAYSAELATDGGYTLRVGVDDNISAKSAGNLTNYVDALKTVLQEFSRQLHTSTKGRFHIKNVELLVPSGWALETKQPTEYVSNEMNTYSASDIRVSRTAKYPYVERSGKCGQPGKYIELPLAYFTPGNDGIYGPRSKSLTALWAQLRYGVFEENGYASNTRYPYFYKQNQSSPFEATGCANKELKGKFQNLAGAVCDPAAGTASCRFVPDADNTATSSLMHFYWLNSVTDFCDDTTHNPLSPNRQNAMCGYRSVMSVIQSTADYTRVTSPPTTPPTVNIRVLEQAPLFYLLVDRGNYDMNAHSTIVKVWAKIFQLFGVSAGGYDIVPPYTVGAVGKFPHTTENEVEDVVPWSTVSENEGAFMDAADFSVGGPETRKYTNALTEVAEKIKAKNHGAGGVILLLRTGGQPHSYAHINYEEQLLATLKQGNIKLNTIELVNPDATPENPSTSNLVNLARESGGTYSVINYNDEVDLDLDNTLSRVIDTVKEYSKDTNFNYDLLYKGQVIKGETNPLPLKINSRAGIHTLRLSFTTLAELNEIRFGDATLGDFQKTNDWMAADTDVGTRAIYSIRLRDIKNPSDVDFSFSCVNETADNCQGFLVSYALYTEENYSNEALEIKISTSAVDDAINFAQSKEPLAVFAKVSKGGLPVTKLSVRATISGAGTGTVVLSDNGQLPDISADDGVYSGYYLAAADGSLNVQVNIVNPTTNTNIIKSITATSPALGRILPVDQSFPVGGPLTGPIKERVIPLPAPIRISNVASFKPYPDAIRTLTIDVKTSSTATLNFNVPAIIGDVATSRVDGYIVRRSESTKTLVENFDSAELVEQNTSPGSNEQFSVNDNSVDSNRRVYYAVKTTYKTAQSELSNLVAVGEERQTTTESPGGASNLTFNFGVLTVTIFLVVRFF